MKLNFNSVLLSDWGSSRWAVPLSSIACVAAATATARHMYYKYIHDQVIFDKPIPFKDFPPQSSFDTRRHSAYPSSYLNAWYHLCDCSELKETKMLEFHVVGQVLILWRKTDGSVVCQDAFCPHAGKLLYLHDRILERRFTCPFSQGPILLPVAAQSKTIVSFVHSTIGPLTVTGRWVIFRISRTHRTVRKLVLLELTKSSNIVIRSTSGFMLTTSHHSTGCLSLFLQN